MSTKERLVAAVRGLIQAENDGSRADAERYVSQTFAVISRSTGKEQGREEMLEQIGSPNPGLVRGFDEEAGFTPWPAGPLQVVRSTVVLTNTTTPDAEPRRFRNLHVFQDEDGQPMCVAWFVAELQKPAPAA
jgi:hypothetical protein